MGDYLGEYFTGCVKGGESRSWDYGAYWMVTSIRIGMYEVGRHSCNDYVTV